jgi:large subunit ribosomal protein L30
MAQLKVTQIRSAIDRPEKQKRTIEALGLGRLHRTRLHNDTPQLRGMLRIVHHLVTVEPVDEA